MFLAKYTLNVTIPSKDRFTVNVLNLFRPYIDKPICDSPFTLRFEFCGWTINIKKILSTSSLAWVTRVVKPSWCYLASSLYTCLTILSLGIWLRRLIAGTLQYIHGGMIPHSPYSIILLVVTFTLKTILQKRNMTLSTIDVPLLLRPQTSLPYIHIGFTTVLKSLRFTFGAIGVMDRNLCRIPNKASPLDHSNMDNHLPAYFHYFYALI